MTVLKWVGAGMTIVLVPEIVFLCFWYHWEFFL